MNRRTSLSCSLILLLIHTVAISYSAETPSDFSIGETPLRSYPATNKSVEAGLLKIRERLRASPEFQTNDALTHLRLAKTLGQQGDPHGAIEEFQIALSLDPMLGEAYRELGAVYIDTHEWSRAEQALGKSVELNPQDQQALYWLGRSLMAQKHFPQARSALKTATLLAPNEAETYSDLGLVFMAQGHILEAKHTLRRAIHQQPDFAEAHYRLEQVLAARNDAQHLMQSAQDILHTLFRRE